jgi:hypothetical protein
MPTFRLTGQIFHRLHCTCPFEIEDYRGDLWSRPALTGDWGGWRNTLAKKGINLDIDIMQGVLGLNSGGSFLNQDSIRYPVGVLGRLL